jgi:hypothetical protein
VVGTALLAATLRVPPGSLWFTVLGLLVAATWTVGSFVSGPIPFQPDREMAWHTFVGPVVAGVAAFGVFLAAYLVARHLPLVGAALDGVLATADAGSITVVLLVALVNGAGEELFFRGALHAAFEPHSPAIAATFVYVVVTAATGNVALVIAAVVMGALFSLERLSTRSPRPHADPPDVVDADGPRPAPLTTSRRRTPTRWRASCRPAQTRRRSRDVPRHFQRCRPGRPGVAGRRGWTTMGSVPAGDGRRGGGTTSRRRAPLGDVVRRSDAAPRLVPRADTCPPLPAPASACRGPSR